MESKTLTSALKQVYYIHKNIVSELNVKIDVLTAEMEQYKSKSQCPSCVSLQEKNQSLQEHLISQLKEKEKIIELLKLKVLQQSKNTNELPEDAKLPSSLSYCDVSPFSGIGKSEMSDRDEDGRVKHSLKLRLIRENKRHSRYHEDSFNAKRMKMSENPDTELKKMVLNLEKLEVLVPETEINVSFSSKEQPQADVSADELSQRLLCVPDTVVLYDDCNDYISDYTQENTSSSQKNLTQIPFIQLTSNKSTLEPSAKTNSGKLPRSKLDQKSAENVSQTVITEQKIQNDFLFPSSPPSKLKVVHLKNNANLNLPVVKETLMAGTLDLNGSLNPDIRLSEYLDSQEDKKCDLNKNQAKKITCLLDETVAPDIISQHHIATIQNGERKANKTSPLADNKLTDPSSLVSSHESQQSEGTLVQDAHWSQTTLCDGAEGDLFEDEDDIVEPSPRQNLKGSFSQLLHSIPSSYKFMPKPKQLFAQKEFKFNKRLKGTVEETSSKESKPSSSEDLKTKGVSEAFVGFSEALEELDRSTEFDVTQILTPVIINEDYQSLADSFDRVPKEVIKEVPHIQVVRKKSERSKLEGFSCQECYNYYKNSGLSEEAMKQKMNECSRHRAKYRPPSTPEHFWSLGLPDTAEIMEQNKTKTETTPQRTDRNPRRRKRLEKRFKARDEVNGSE